ncbi:hypothetical protein [Zobellia alginiliquefaciens]|uniref:hypothetical protein n=1 Tax=Zobellia alginiliquefaciens TaxID=3032586 RepID=UPI0023E3CC99|nr:hypothetical protein [Zobellia alginiliquefaciens]
MSIDTLYRFKKVRPVVELFNDELYYVGVQEIRDTILQKKILKKSQDLIYKENKKNQERAEEIFDKGDY